MQSYLRSSFSCFVALLLAPAVACAEPLFAPASQTRTVSAHADASHYTDPPVSSSQKITAPDFGPFSETATASASAGPGGASGWAGQVSSIDSGALTASGYARVTGSVTPYPHSGTANASASSVYDVSFTLPEETPVQLVGVISAYSDGPGRSSKTKAELQGPEGIIMSEVLDTFFYLGELTLPLDRVYDLDPGSYRFLVFGNAGGFWDGWVTGPARADYDVSLRIIPEPAPLGCAGVTLALFLGCIGRGRAPGPGSAQSRPPRCGTHPGDVRGWRP